MMMYRYTMYIERKGHWVTALGEYVTVTVRIKSTLTLLKTMYITTDFS